jgi:hypothetical protein
MRLRVLVGCERSGRVREAFRRLGADAWSNDLVPADDGSPFHILDDVRAAMRMGHWDIGIFHPPCTYLTRAGARWKRDPADIEAAIGLFMACLNAPIRHVAVENPRMVGEPRRRLGDPAQVIQPHMFGHPRYKATCLWLRNLPPLMVMDDVSEIARWLPRKVTHEMLWMPPGPDRARRRSETYPGIAEAFADQWGAFVAMKAAA